MKHAVQGTLVESRALDADTFLHVYDAPEVAREARPGQFVHVRVSHLTAPLLRRPISILWSDGARNVHVLFKLVRSGTRLLAEKRVGEKVDLAGPLGSPFPYDPARPALMVAGGYGIGPVHFLARANRAAGNRRTLVYGAATASSLHLREDLGEAFDEVLYVTEDGSLGAKGLATDPLARLLETDPAVYACGPTPMLAALRRAADRSGRQLPLWLSMENRMGCGVGACMGCVIQTMDGVKTVCKDGPVSDGHRLLFS